MRFLIMLLIVQGMFFTTVASATPATFSVKNGEHVLRNITPSQCPASIEGAAGPENVVAYGDDGEYQGTTGPGMRSCTNCKFISGDCVCDCTYNFN